TPEGRTFVAEITKTIVSQVAPEELDLFDELIQEYFRNPQPVPPATPSDDPLGFGVGEIVAAVTPAAAAMVSVSGVLEFLAAAWFKASMEEGAELTLARARQLWTRTAERTESPASLTQQQILHISTLARQQALRFGMDEKVAENMAAALVGSLVL